jgi:ABC-type polysaccharide/polyol phosphate export permease
MPDLLWPVRAFRRRDLILLREVARVHHQALDQSTALGYLWSLIHPLVMLSVLYFTFRRRVGSGIEHYPIFLLIGVVMFTSFSKSLNAGMRSLQQMRSLVTGVIFPKDLLVYSSILVKAPEFVVSMIVTLGLALISGTPGSPALLALPLIILLQLVCVTWAALFLSIGYVFVRDLDHIYEVGMRILFFVTPIIFSLDQVSPSVRRILSLNPLSHLIGYARDLILRGTLPPLSDVGPMVLGNLVMLYLGMVLFRRSELLVMERI